MSPTARDTRPSLVREADGNDLQAVLDIGHRTWRATYGPVTGDDYVEMGLAKWWTPEATIPAIRAGRVLVAEVDGEVVGMVSFGPRDDQLVVWKIYVLPERHGRGVGSSLLRAVLERAEGRYDEVWLSHIEGVERAGDFYRAHGFTEVEREPGDGGLPGTVWLRRRLDTATAPKGDA